MLNGCHASVQQLSNHANKSQNNTYDKRLSSNVVQATASALQDLTIKFRKCQSTYLHSKCSHISRHCSDDSVLELKSRKDNFNQIMPDLEINTRSNPFGDQENNFDQISVRDYRCEETIPMNVFLVNFRRSTAIDDTKCGILRKT